MAYFDRAAAEGEIEAEKAYKNLVMDTKGSTDEQFILARWHAYRLDSRINQLQDKIAEYEKFFSTLSSLLPSNKKVVYN